MRVLNDMKEWNTVVEMLRSLNDLKCKTMVLRNFELFSDNKLIEKHEDIDLLCDDFEQVIDALSPMYKKNQEQIHLNVCIAGMLVVVDLRWAGDSYYDEKWEREMLERRVMTEDGYYVPDAEDYIYSLLYHGLFHKKDLKPGYVNRILETAKKNGIEIKEGKFSEQLNEYMELHGYIDTGYRSK